MEVHCACPTFSTMIVAISPMQANSQDTAVALLFAVSDTLTVL